MLTLEVVDIFHAFTLADRRRYSSHQGMMLPLTLIFVGLLRPDTSSPNSLQACDANGSANDRVSITDECITAFNEFRMSRGKTKYIIYKIADNRKEIVIDEISNDPDYEAFRSRLEAAQDAKGKPAPRYAVYDVEFELGGVEGKRCDTDSASMARGRNADCITGTRFSSSPGYLQTLQPSYVSQEPWSTLTDANHSGPCYMRVQGRI
jgi:Cofilin/tropomyosin-type actin-binding protein